MDEIKKIREIICSGNITNAIALLTSITDKRIQETGDHFEWYKLSEELGLYNIAIRELNLAYRDDPKNPEIIQKLVDYSFEKGEIEKAVSYLENLLSFSAFTTSALESLVELYFSRNEIENAKKATENAIRYGLEENVARKIFKMHEKPVCPEIASYEEAKGESLLPSDEDAIRFLSLFSGREDVYARQWYSAAKGRGGYSPVEEPLTPRILRQHFLGDMTAGIYCLRLDNTVKFFAFDIDLTRRALENIHYPEQGVRLRTELKSAAKTIMTSLQSYDLDFVLESSGYKGFHIWVFLEHAIPAEIIFNFGRLFLQIIKYKIPLDISCEFFPKQIRSAEKGYSNLIKLPLGIHLKTGKRSNILNKDFILAEKPFDLLKNVSLTSREKIHTIIGNIKLSPTLRVDEKEKHKKEAQKDEDLPFSLESQESQDQAEKGISPEPIKEYLGPALPPAWTEADFQLNPEINHLLTSCPVLSALKSKVDVFGQLSYDETIVLQHTLGHIQGGILAVNYLLSRCANLKEDSFLKSEFKGNPISCPRIRKRIPELTSKIDCSCNFINKNHYPTPVLHLESLVIAKDNVEKVQPSDIQKDTSTIHDRARKYLRLLSLSQKIETDLQQLKDDLWSFLMNQQDHSMHLEDGTFEASLNECVKEITFKPKS